jgi:hypothetical protein
MARRRRFGVRQLAAAFDRASLLAQPRRGDETPREQAPARQSGSELPHSIVGDGEDVYLESLR